MDNESSRNSLSGTTSAPLPNCPIQNKPRSDREEMLSRAANLIRETMDLNGVVFLDPRLGSTRYYAPECCHTAKEIGRLSELGAESPIRPRSDVKILPNEVSGLVDSAAPPVVQFCKVLACSTRTDSGLDDNSYRFLAVSEDALHGIIRSFPRGCVLTYDSDGLVSTNPLELAWYNRIPKSKEGIEAAQRRQNCSSDSHIEGITEAHELCHMFPDVRSIILFPLWDSSGGKLLAY